MLGVLVPDSGHGGFFLKESGTARVFESVSWLGFPPIGRPFVPFCVFQFSLYMFETCCSEKSRTLPHPSLVPNLLEVPFFFFFPKLSVGFVLFFFVFFVKVLTRLCPSASTIVDLQFPAPQVLHFLSLCDSAPGGTICRRRPLVPSIGSSAWLSLPFNFFPPPPVVEPFRSASFARRTCSTSTFFARPQKY